MNGILRPCALGILACLCAGDLVAQPASQVLDIMPGSLSSAIRYIFGASFGKAFFVADDGTNGRELWISDGTPAGTQLVDICPGPCSSYLTFSNPKFVEIGGTVFFSADDGTNGEELWKSDGTVSGTVMVKDIRVGPGDSLPDFLTDFDGTLFLQADNGTNGDELWKSDGTAAGTMLAADTRPGLANGRPEDLGVVYDTLYFGETSNGEVWKSDGTAAGTVLVKAIWPAASVRAEWFTGINGFAVFTQDEGATGNELYRTDGTTAGTILLKDIYPGSISSLPRDLFAFGNQVFFRAYDGVVGEELWSTDGTSPGTTLFKDINPGSASSGIAEFTAMDGYLYFRAVDATNGSELWRSDGTPAGTQMLVDIRAGSPSSQPGWMVDVGGTLVFSADDGIIGRELWRSDGSAAGTVLLQDLRSGLGASDPQWLAVAGNRLFFAASGDPASGQELWSLQLDALPFFTVTSTHQQNRLEWVNPMAGSALVFRFDTSAFPQTPSEGMPLVVPAGTPSTHQVFDHTGLANDTTYFYTVFVDNGSGVETSRSAKGRPQDTTGPIKWIYNTGASSLTPPGIGSVYAVANDDILHGMNPGVLGGDWPPGWTPFPMTAPSQSRPVVVAFGAPTPKLVFIGSQDGHVYAVDADTGSQFWKSPDLGLVQASPAGIFSMFPNGAFDLLLVGTRNSAGGNAFHALNLADGSIAWSFVNSAAQGGDDTGIGIISGSASVDYLGKRLYFASRAQEGGSDKTLWCLDFTATTANLCWSEALGNIDGSPVLRGSAVYVGDNAGNVLARAAGTGAPLWSVSTGDGPVKRFVWADVNSSRLYFSTTTTVWGLTDTGTMGMEDWRVTSIPSPSTPLLVPGTNFVYVGGGDGRLHQLDLVGGSPTITPLILGDGSSAVGSPALEVVFPPFVYVGTDDAAVHAVAIPY